MLRQSEYSYSSGVPNPAIVPYGRGILSPLHPCDTIVIRGYKSHDIIANPLVLIAVYIIDSGNV
jgi:hypothetical protein